MKIIYITKARLPTEKAYGTNMVKTCEALAKTGVEVMLVVPRCGNKSAPDDIFSYYAIKNIFKVRYLPIVDSISLGWDGGFWINHFSFLFAVFFTGLGEKRECVILARDELAAFFLKMKGYRVYYDMHGFPEKKRWFWKIIMRRMDGIIATNKWKVERCASLFNISKEKMVVAPNGFDAEAFKKNEGKEQLRRDLDLPTGVRIVLYTGHLYDWKGAGVLLEAARQFPISNSRFPILFIFVGGTESDILAFREKARGVDTILILGYKPPADIPKYLKAADVLVLPNSQFSRNARFAVYSRHDTSPIKLFEYMASGTPIVASRLPSIQEILNEENAMLVSPDDPQELLRGIQSVLLNPARALTRAERALSDSKKYTWDKRAERVIQFIGA